MKGSPALRAIGLATLVAGCLDISSAFVIFILKGIGLTRGLQGIAVALLGRPTAFAGGGKTALFGLCLHFFVMLCVVTVFYTASRIFPLLGRRPLLSGI